MYIAVCCVLRLVLFHNHLVLQHALISEGAVVLSTRESDPTVVRRRCFAAYVAASLSC